ncbi:MAG: AAA family ATPase [Gammaproteobacteria bacterium]|nr:AAA family ATPase [Gammaproteobacteria bacterium]
MAIYHLSAGFVSRSSGRSAVQSAAYITGERLMESRRDLVADYTHLKDRVLFSTTLFPDKVPDKLKNLNIWDKLESYEDRYGDTRYKTQASQDHYKGSSQTAQTIELALPKELTPESWQALVLDFAKERFVSRGLVVTVAIHKDEGNPHAHFQISRRALNKQGDWSWAKDRGIVSKTALIETRALWAELANQALEREGFSVRIDHRSYLEQGIGFEPTQHEGWFAHKLERLGLSSRIIEENKAIRAQNQTLASLEPALILEELCAKQSTFSSTQLSALVQARVGDDAPLHSIVYEESLRQAIPVGVSLDGQTRYSSSLSVAQEQEALSAFQAQLTQPSALAIHPSLVSSLLESPAYAQLNEEQSQAVSTLCSPFQLGLLLGRAGTGKTTTLQPVVEAHQKAGYTVIGLCLSASAAENLSLEAKIKAETIAFYLDKWERATELKAEIAACPSILEGAKLQSKLSFLNSYALSERHLVLLDEAGMVGTPQWHRLLHFVGESGAKLIGVGDDHQFKAIDRGDFFRVAKGMAQAQGKLCELKDIQRQREPWMKEASVALSELRTQEALASYENHGLVEPLKKGTEGFRDLAQRYVEQCLAHPEQSSSLMAYTRAECAALNTEVRLILQAKGLVESLDYPIHGQIFSVKDHIIFLTNDRKHDIETFDPHTGRRKDFLVKNGTQGTILEIHRVILEPKDRDPSQKPQIIHHLRVAIDAQTHALVNTESYSDFVHAYSTTLHKSQGRTVDWSMVLVSKYMDAYGLYVALTRHRQSTTLFYQKDAFANFKELQSSMARLGHKDLVMDYSIHADHQGAWESVQEYKLFGQDLSATLKEKNWESYNTLKAERETVGKNILEDWETHREFARQAGLSFESIAINCGLKARPLSLAEQQAKNTVGLYAEKALEARTLWKEITQTHPGTLCIQHAEYRTFTELRQERNSLAKTITEYPALHRAFVQALAKTQGIGWKTLESQAEQKINFELYDRAGQGSSREASVENNPMQNARAIREGLNQNITALAQDLLGDPTRKTAREWRYGSQGGISIALAGTKQGCYANFETGSFGGPLKLIQDHQGVDYPSALQWAGEWLGLQKPIEIQTEKQSQKLSEPELWTPILPSKKHPLPESLKNEPALAYQFTREKQSEVERYAYRDAEGHLLGYTVRLEDKEGQKVVLPLSYCENTKGQTQWRWKHFHEGADRSLYGLERLTKYPDKPVLVVEGEKTANKAQKRLPEWVVVSWSGGTGATHKTDFSPLLGRTINLWPDNDVAGIKAMERIADQLVELHEKKEVALYINAVEPSEDLPLKWDLADPLPKGWSIAHIKELIADPSKEEEKTHTLLPEKEPNTAQNNLKPIEDILTDHGLSLQGSFKATLKAYGLEQESLQKDFLVQSRALYSELLLCHQSTEQGLSIALQTVLMERAIVAQALEPLAKERFYPSEAPLKASLRTQEIALIGARLLQETSHHPLNAILDKAKEDFDQQLSQQPLRLKGYKQKYSEKSQRSVEILTDQVMLYQNRTGLQPYEDLCRKILDTSLHLQYVEHSGDFKEAVSGFEISPLVPFEKDQVIATTLERHFMRLSLWAPEAERMPSLRERLEKAVTLSQGHYNVLSEKNDEKIRTVQEAISKGSHLWALAPQDFEKSFKATVEKYGLYELKVKPSETLRCLTQDLYDDMISWQRLLGAKPSVERQSALFEKAMITQILAPKIKEDRCYCDSPLEAKHNTETVGLLAAGMMQTHGNKYSLKDYLRSADDTRYKQRNEEKPQLLKDYQNLYPTASDRALGILVEQTFLLKNQCNYLLDPKTRDILLNASQRLEALESKGMVFDKVQTLVHEQMPTRDRETKATVSMNLDREFMRMVTRDPSRGPAQHARDPQYLERCLDRAADNSQKTNQMMVQQEAVLIKQRQQERILSRDKDLDRGFER